MKTVTQVLLALIVAVLISTNGYGQDRTISVGATTRITDSGISLGPGQTALITAAGVWNVTGNPNRNHGPTGNGVVANNRTGFRLGFPGVQDTYAWEHAQEGALVVYLNNAPKAVYGGGQLSVSGPGRLGFGPNDDNLGDNTGAVSVTIHVQGTAAPSPAPAPQAQSCRIAPASGLGCNLGGAGIRNYNDPGCQITCPANTRPDCRPFRCYPGDRADLSACGCAPR